MLTVVRGARTRSSISSNRSTAHVGLRQVPDVDVIPEPVPSRVG